jgi:coenzyme F420-reducing hydrogenase alpha subunit
LEIAGKVIRVRRECRDILNHLCGKVIHPVCGLPGGVSKGLDEEHRVQFLETAKFAVEFALKIFDDVVLKNKVYVDIVLGDAYKMKTYYMGLVDGNNKVNFYDGDIRVVNPEGKEFAKFKPREYLNHVSEHVEPWSYIKFPFLKKVGWKGFVEGKESGVYRVAPRGTLFHHYKTDEKGIVTEANLIVATINSAAAITMSIEKADKAFIKGGKISEGLLNMAEMAFRPYDPCHACGTHALPGDMPLVINIYDKNKELIKQLKR